MTDDSPNKRKRSFEDDGDRDHKKSKPVGMDILHRDVGAKYLICQTPQKKEPPLVSQDLFELFGLNDLAAEVAREKPNGEKNALRKTYKGHMKRLGVAGHFDVVKKPEDMTSEFLAMCQVPEEEWCIHQVKGKEINNGLSEATLSVLGRATTMAKGPIPKGVWDTSVLGDLAPSSGDANKQGKPATPGTPLAATPGANNNRAKPDVSSANDPARMKGGMKKRSRADSGFEGPGEGHLDDDAGGYSTGDGDTPHKRRKSNNLAPGDDPTRPKRNIKKRAYGDNSFEGYGEGYPDDDAAVDGYSTGEGEGPHKRRKQSGNASPYLSAMRQQNYGPGMVGV